MTKDETTDLVGKSILRIGEGSMNEPGFDSERLRLLTLQKCDGTITEDGTTELCDLLAESSGARERYWQMVAVHSELDWELGGAALASVSCPGRVPDQLDNRAFSLPRLSLAAAVLIAVSAMWWMSASLRPAELKMRLASKQAIDGSPVLGTVAAVGSEAKWSLGRSEGRDSNEIRQGDTIWLEEGVIQLRLGSDSIATLESPVIANLLSADRVRLLRGTIKVDSESEGESPSPRGLTVETELAEVVDLGTTYSVTAEGDSTDVVVFDGSVALNPESLVKGENQYEHFHTGEAVRVSSDKVLTRIVSVCQSHVLASRKVQSSKPVISSVGDNNSRNDFYSFYEIVPGGMSEDAHAFVDRRHQWNGIDGPMPEYLAGGDYVKTFNDDKVTEGLEIDLSVARPCTLYVLLDNRVEVPGWLKASFRDTGDDIGVDEHLRHLLRDKRIVLGAGRSIDQTHSIWSRDLLQPGKITLGPNGTLRDSAKQGEDSRSNMYGIVAVGIDDGAKSSVAISNRSIPPVDLHASLDIAPARAKVHFLGNIDLLFGKF